jgi:hypothetical protein
VAGVFEDGGLRVRRVLGDDCVCSSSNWRAIPGVETKSTMAITVDNLVELEGVDGHAASIHGVGGVSVFVELVEGGSWSASRGGEWSRGARGRLQERLGGSGRARGVRGVVGVLKQLGGIPPSSLGARGGRRQGREVGWAGWAVALGVR